MNALATRASRYDRLAVKTRDYVTAVDLKWLTDGFASTGRPSPAKRDTPRCSSMRARGTAGLQTVEDLPQARVVAAALFALSGVAELEEWVATILQGRSQMRPSTAGGGDSSRPARKIKGGYAQPTRPRVLYPRWKS